MPEEELLAAVTEVAGIKVLPPCAIYEKVGQGGMGAVYRAWHLNLDIEVAVKVLKPRRVDEDPLYIERFWREGRSAARISHQNVVRVYDVGEHEGLHYIVMEFVAGETARQRVVRKGPLAVGEAVQILYEAAQGLGEAHRQGLVHRDMKPDNLLISSAGQVKVADMGLAKPSFGSAEQSMMSSPDQIMGTPSYMPPEQWETPKVSAAADVWALGATLWFLLAGDDAITEPDGNTARIMRRILMQPFPDIRTVRNDVPEGVSALLARATARDAAERFLDAGEIVAAIDQLEVRRATLRDRSGGTTEAVTLVSPPPVPRVDEIKRRMREGRRPDARPPRASSRTATVAVAMPDSEPQPALVPMRRRSPAVLVASLLVFGAGGGAYACWPRPQREPEVPAVAVPDAPALLFTTAIEPVEPRVDGFVITTQATIRVRVGLREADAQLFVGGEQLAVTRDGDAIVCALPVANEGRQTVTLTAKKPGFTDATTSIDVVRLTRGPVATIVAPSNDASTDATSVAFEVTADEWTRSVDVAAAGGGTPLARAGTSNTWRGTVPLARGSNRLAVSATDLTGRKGAGAVASIVCTAVPASVSGTLCVDGELQPLALDGPTVVRSADVRLDATLAGTSPRLLVDGAPAAATSFDLGERLCECQEVELVLTPVNDLGAGDALRVRVVLVAAAPAPTRAPATEANANTPAPPAPPAANDAARSEPAPVARAELKRFDGFRSEPKDANDLGYPALITHDTTGIELVAVGLREGVKPQLYAARQMTTERQWSAGGGSGTKTGVSGAAIAQWLGDRGKGLALPRESDWELIRGCSELKQVDAGPIEWLQPTRPSNRWPIRKDPSRADYKYTDSIGFGFRTVLRVP